MNQPGRGLSCPEERKEPGEDQKVEGNECWDLYPGTTNTRLKCRVKPDYVIKKLCTKSKKTHSRGFSTYALVTLDPEGYN